MREQVLSSKVIWLCLRCYTCTANCPHDVDFSNIMMTLREMAIEAGYAPPDILEKIDAITMAANDLRKDCINLLLQEGATTKEQIQDTLQKTLEQIG
jgi:heterodisulfide reductase subunit C